MTLYFAYGSNLNLKQMEFRCPDAVPIAPVIIPNMKLVFKVHADIVKSNDHDVLGGLWKITEDCEKSLDIYEGCDGDYYEKKYLDYNGEKVLVYVMTKKHDLIQCPTDVYFNSILTGYKDFGLPTRPLFAALEDAKKNGVPLYDTYNRRFNRSYYDRRHFY